MARKTLPGIISEKEVANTAAAPKALNVKEFTAYYNLGVEAGRLFKDNPRVWSQVRDAILTGMFAELVDECGSRSKVMTHTGVAQNTLSRYFAANKSYLNR